MSDELLPYYNRELAFFRSMGADFARNHPKIAARLRLSPDGSQDPHVERMVEAFAYLNARIRHKLEDDFPELTDAMLGVLYPHFQNPTPSLSIVEMKMARDQGELTAGYAVERGTRVDTESAGGENCQFRTCYPLRLWPIEVKAASLTGRPFAAPPTAKSQQAIAVLKIEVSTISPNVNIGQMALGSLRFYLHAAQSQNVYELYELLFNNTLEVVLAGSPGDPRAVVLPPSVIGSVGFGRDEGMFPYTARSFPGYRLMSEYFSFPEKFLFFDLNGLTAQRLAHLGNKLEIYFYLSRSSSDQERNVSAETFRLGCTPISNLFPHRADPLLLSGTTSEYRVVPDARRPMALEIYTVDRVAATSPEGEQVEFVPFYSFRHAVDRESQHTFWHATRKPAVATDDSAERDSGTDIYLSLVDLGFSPTVPAEWTLDIETTCFNRDLPRLLPFGGGRPSLDLPDGRGPVGEMVCLTPPTPTRRAALKHRAMWRLVSHLSLNHLSLAESDGGADALREILMLYDVTDSSATRAMIEGVAGVASRRVVGRAGGAAGSFCRGVEVSVELDEEKFIGSGAYLFAAVLNQFLGLYCSINSFTRLVAKSKQREGQGEPWKWPQRAGERVLL